MAMPTQAHHHGRITPPLPAALGLRRSGGEYETPSMTMKWTTWIVGDDETTSTTMTNADENMEKEETQKLGWVENKNYFILN